MSTSRLRRLRKSANLTQREVARLVGYASQRAYSDMELGLKRPALGIALACCIVFDTPLDHLFPTLWENVERDMLARARKLLEDTRSRGNNDRSAAFIGQVVARLDEPASRQ